MTSRTAGSRREFQWRPIVPQPLEVRALLSVAPQTYTVVSLSDSGPGSLRDAVASADADTFPAGTHDTIVFDPSLARNTIVLSTSVNDPTYGPSALMVSVPMVIDGTSAASLTIARAEGTASHRLFLVTSTGNLTLNDLTLSGGQTAGPANIGGAVNGGGAVNNEGVLALTNVVLSGNSAGSGAALYNGESATATLTDDTLISNSGGAIANSGEVGNPSGYGSLRYCRKSWMEEMKRAAYPW